MKEKGYTLLELQAAAAILAFAVAGMAALFVTEVKQVQWLETTRQRYALLSTSPGQAVFTEIYSPGSPTRATQRVEVQSLAVSGSSTTAVVALQPR
ncbi:MAG TPA: hypothetical protein VNI01_05250 [Elusimicrobiota bacterium]|nr:hypothetical protein [Elusimicrobiota bacterium]